MPKNFPEGEIILIDKPYGWTSFDVVNKLRNEVRNHYGIKKLKIGHAGTLDPLATGLLIICTGKFTKRISEFQAGEKEYTGTFYMGATTPSFDKETEPDRLFPTDHLTPENIKNAAGSFVGDQEQIPPLFSAVKINGKRAYEFARKNKDIELIPKKVNVKEFEITKVELPEVAFRLVCSKGFYVRALARDFGELLGSGAYLAALRRTRIGDFHLDKALSVSEFRELLINKK